MHIKENPTSFRRFSAIWTPTILILDEGGIERWRVEGYLPKIEFRAELEMGRARLDAVRKRWAEAEQRYAHIAQTYADSRQGPDALYWRYVSEYSRTRDHAVLATAARELRARHPSSQAAQKSLIWG